jgi:Uma2 family endonuclease
MEAIDEKISTYELERGKPIPTLTHGAIQANLTFELKTIFQKPRRVASEVTLDTLPLGSTPDLVVYPIAPLNFLDEPARRPDAPLLTIEIQSPSQSMNEMVEKVERYFAFGVQSSWVVVPSIQAILVYDRPGHYIFFHADDVLRDDMLAIQLSLGSIFQ